MDYKYTDIHCHPNFPQYDADRDEVIQKMKDERVVGICVGTDEKTSRECVELASRHEHLFSSIGLHPTHAENGFDINAYAELTGNKKVVAVGECGLDYFRREGSEAEKELQKSIFVKHVEFARDINLPLMIHCRPSAGGVDAYEDILTILSNYKDVRGNVHFFVGNLEIAKKFLDIGFTMSFTAVITFTHDYDEVIKFLPLEKVMSETDSPFVAPASHRGQRNEPVYVKEVVKRIAEIKNLSIEETAKAIRQNAQSLFGI
jgi:TatD DNase family protein